MMTEKTKTVRGIALVLIALAMVAATLFSGCNKQVFDTTYEYKYAVVMRADGEQLIPIKSWTDFEDGDQLQFTSTDGITYLTHAENVILLTEAER